MSNETQESVEMGTQPLAEHAWLQNLVGEWQVESEFLMGPEGGTQTSTGTNRVRSLGGLWAVGEAEMTMGGTTMTMISTLGYDVSFKEYRGCWFASMSSHLWKYAGGLSADGKTMTLECEGPSMVEDGKTALYRDVIELIDDDHYTLTSYDKDSGVWSQYMKANYTRVG